MSPLAAAQRMLVSSLVSVRNVTNNNLSKPGLTQWIRGTMRNFMYTNAATHGAAMEPDVSDRRNLADEEQLLFRRKSGSLSETSENSKGLDSEGFKSIISEYSRRSNQNSRQISKSYGRKFNIKRHHEHIDPTPEESLFWAQVSSLRSKKNKSYNVDMLLARLRNSSWRTARHYNALMRSAPKSETPRIFIALRADKQLKPNEYSYFLLVEAYTSLGGMLEAKRCVDLLEKQNMNVNSNIYNALLHGYARQGDVANAMKTYETMRSRGMALGINTQNLLLMAHGKANKLDTMQALFEKMTENEYDEKIQEAKCKNGTYEIMLSSYAAAGNVVMARSIFDRMVEKGHTPRECHLTPMANAYVTAKDAEGAKAFLRELEENAIPIHTNLFAIVLKALADQGNYEEVLQMIKRRGANHEQVTTKIWSCLVQAYAVAGRMKLARRVVDDMISSKRLDCHPNVVTYTIMINGYGMANELDKAQEILGEMVSRRIRPNSYTFTSLAQLNMKHGRLDEASKYIMEALQLDLDQNGPNEESNKVLLLTLLELYGRRRNFPEMLRLWERLSRFLWCRTLMHKKEGTLDLHGLNEWGAKLAVISELRRIRNDLKNKDIVCSGPLTIVTGKGLKSQNRHQEPSFIKENHDENQNVQDNSTQTPASSSGDDMPLPLLRRVVGELLYSLGIESKIPKYNDGCFVISLDELKRISSLEDGEVILRGGLAPMLLSEEKWAIRSDHSAPVF